MLLSSNAVMPVYFSAKVKTWMAISAGLILLLLADILKKAYQALPLAFPLPESFSSSSFPLLLALSTVVPVTIIAHKSCMHSCASTAYENKVRPTLIGILSGSLFFALFILLLGIKDVETRHSYLLRLASFSQYLRKSDLYELLAFVFSIHVFRPILEELVFRGLIFQSIAAKYGLISGVVFSSAGFAVIHSGLEFSPLFAFLFGVVSCGLVYFSRGMAASFSFHMTYNSLITIFGFLRGS